MWRIGIVGWIRNPCSTGVCGQNGKLIVDLNPWASVTSTRLARDFGSRSDAGFLDCVLPWAYSHRDSADISKRVERKIGHCMALNTASEVYRVSNYRLPTGAGAALAVPYFSSKCQGPQLAGGDTVVVTARRAGWNIPFRVSSLVPVHQTFTRDDIASLPSDRAVQDLVKYSVPGAPFPSWSVGMDRIVIAASTEECIPTGCVLGLSREEEVDPGPTTAPCGRRYRIIYLYASVQSVSLGSRLFLPFSFTKAIEIVRILEKGPISCTLECVAVDTGETVFVWIYTRYLDLRSFEVATGFRLKMAEASAYYLDAMRGFATSTVPWRWLGFV
ncbi:hypothetical protein C8R47DRAFT_1066095 [Mycena vitilis]|nr:hypothetical protein C8R47DRAFT_1066095 [Mycena vitilis]